MKIEVYQHGKKLTDINLADDSPAEVWITTKRHVRSGTERRMLDFNNRNQPIIILSHAEGEMLDPQDDRSRS